MNTPSPRLIRVRTLFLLACMAAGTPMPLFANEVPPAVPAEKQPAEKQRVEVVFVLDSTGSMGGLIEGAKQKIWSIAGAIVAKNPSADVRIGLVSYRDRGDEYITKKFDLTADLDAVFKNLQSFQANGGGDAPESVNQALKEAVGDMPWSKDKASSRILFLVGDCPPHMDYQDDVKYAVSCKAAAEKGIRINTVQCGNDAATTPIWKEIAQLGGGSYIGLAQSGGMVEVATPVDGKIAELSAALGRTAVAYGTEEAQAEVLSKNTLAAKSAPAVAASRACYNLASGGKAIQGRGDLLADMAEGHIKLEAVKDADLPKEMQKMTLEERKAHVAKQQEARAALNTQLAELLRQRAECVARENKRLAKEGKGDAFDLKVNEVIAEQMKKGK